jgi:hypothetical protein
MHPTFIMVQHIDIAIPGDCQGDWIGQATRPVRRTSPASDRPAKSFKRCPRGRTKYMYACQRNSGRQQRAGHEGGADEHSIS